MYSKNQVTILTSEVKFIIKNAFDHGFHKTRKLTQVS